MTIHIGPNEWQLLEARILGDDIHLRCGQRHQAHHVEHVPTPIDGASLCRACLYQTNRNPNIKKAPPKFVRLTATGDGDHNSHPPSQPTPPAPTATTPADHPDTGPATKTRRGTR